MILQLGRMKIIRCNLELCIVSFPDPFAQSGNETIPCTLARARHFTLYEWSIGILVMEANDEIMRKKGPGRDGVLYLE